VPARAELAAAANIGLNAGAAALQPKLANRRIIIRPLRKAEAAIGAHVDRRIAGLGVRPGLNIGNALAVYRDGLMLRDDESGGGKSPLADVRVRQAMAMSLDKSFICDTVTRMGEIPARTYLPPDGTLPDFHWQPGPFGILYRVRPIIVAG